jgi:hypothetical protein
MSILSRLFGGKPPTPALLSVHDYAERYADTVRAACPGAVVTVEHAVSAAQTRVHWVADDGFKASQFMGNAYTRYLQEPRDIDNLQARQLEEARTVQATFDAPLPGLDCILPVIKTTGWAETTAAQLDAAGVPHESRPLSWPLAGDLLLAYVEDLPDTMNYVTAARLKSLGLEEDALRSLALKNLSRLLPALDVKGGGGGRYAARLDRNYDASMVLLFSQWRSRLDVAGEPVIVIAARDDVLICGSDDAASLAELQVMADTIAADSPYGLSRQLFVWRDGALQRHQP